MKKLIPIVIIVIALGAWGMTRWLDKPAEGKLTVSGTIEVTEAAVSFSIPGRMTDRLVSEGDRVHLGQTIATLDRTELERELKFRQSERAAAEALLAELENGSRIEDIHAAQERVHTLQADLERITGDFERGEALLEKDVISRQEFEHLDAAKRMAESRLAEADQALKRLENGPRKEQVEQARARLQAAGESVALVQVRLGYTTLASPLTGMVLADSVEPGEVVNAGTPVVTVADLEHVWFKAYVAEPDLGKVQLGQQVEITTDSWPERTFTGSITTISNEAEFTPRMVQTQRERVKLVYRIKVTIDNPDLALKPGMPADGVIRL